MVLGNKLCIIFIGKPINHRLSNHTEEKCWKTLAKMVRREKNSMDRFERCPYPRDRKRRNENKKSAYSVLNLTTSFLHIIAEFRNEKIKPLVNIQVRPHTFQNIGNSTKKNIRLIIGCSTSSMSAKMIMNRER